MSNMSGQEMAGSVGPACNYALLGNYNNNLSAGAQTMGSTGPSNAAGSYVVPAYGMSGYDALQHGNGVGNCGGYFSVTNAYGQNAGNCNTQYMKTMCQ